MRDKLNILLENKLNELPIFVNYTKLNKKTTIEKRVIQLNEHNTTRYFAKPFYKMIYPINLNEDR
jgi:hypothetical protein